ncbi:lysozyme [Serratia marcescens]|uniref:glycoside hydrolase family 24 protein n=1 Tax=Serratia marcescens TaxID=615 RepID=UPI000EF2350F|nr:glycoside hydrolase family 104 protein [Serratia marcescens]RLO25833.1 lysozyme [Serratia marcescens]RLO39088.1 lysozyme [Serratia marcescens]
MARIVTTPNINAYLDTLRFSEIGATLLARSDEGYNVIVTGVDGKAETFASYRDHPFAGGRPGKVFNSRGQRSTASGGYQFLIKDWGHYRTALKLPDFGPVSQDKWAIQLIRERGALADINAGRIELALKKCRNIWASLPGAGYGQPEHKLETLLKKYISYGGALA